jgi:hypothetical protein
MSSFSPAFVVTRVVRLSSNVVSLRPPHNANPLNSLMPALDPQIFVANRHHLSSAGRLTRTPLPATG